MQIDSIWFVYLFLPCLILFCYLLPAKFRSAVISVFNIAFLLFVQPAMLALVLAFVLVDYALGILIEQTSVKLVKNIFLFMSLTFNIAVFAVSQYFLAFPAVIGVAVITLVKIDYICDIMSGRGRAVKNIFSYLSVVLFFPCLEYGPILNFSEASYMMHSGKRSLTLFGDGASLFIYGLFKKVIVSDMLYMMLDSVSFSSDTVLGAWMYIVFSALAFYYMLLGYSQMARGICKMIGFNIHHNFCFPFTATSVSDFFRRFNISLTNFFRKNVYITLGGNRQGTMSFILAVAASSVLMSMWYGLAVNKLIAGLYFALIIVLEKTMLSKLNFPVFRFLHTLLTYPALAIGFAVFSTDTVGAARSLISTAFGLSEAALYDSGVLLCISSYLPIIILSVFLLFGFSKNINRVIQHRRSFFWNMMFVAFNLTVLFVCTTHMV